MKRSRSQRGSLLILYVLLLSLIIFPFVGFLAATACLFLERSTIQPKVDALALIAANDLSKIVVEDPYFGFISLSNYPPTGKNTLAADGEPLPVIGINTLIGTIWQNAVIAEKIDNGTMLNLVGKDQIQLDAACQKLNQTLVSAVKPESNGLFSDFKGERVCIFADVKKEAEKTLGGDFRIKSLTVSDGWLQGGGTTTITNSAGSNAQVQAKEELAPFVDIKVKAIPRTFQFAGLGPTATLCKPQYFRPADDKHVCSIIRVDCVVERVHPFDNIFSMMGMQANTLSFSSAAQPFTNPDTMPPGVLTLRCAGGISARMNSWSDLLSQSTFANGEVRHFVASGGDYPTDAAATIIPDPNFSDSDESNSASLLAECLYCWLRNGHLRPAIASVIDMLQKPFKSDGRSDCLLYEFGKDGQILSRNLDQNPFKIGVVSDQQSLTFADTSISGLGQCFVSVRNQVRNLGNGSGGKHAGQALAGFPLDWCERSEYQGSVETAKAIGKGSKGTNLLVTPSGDTFCKLNGRSLINQPRRTYYSGGLAADIEMTIQASRY
jgi:hypothetical protein